jgi:hypothetical protein
MNEEQEKALRDYDTARREVQKSMVGKPGARAENALGETYQRLVSLGLAPKLKSRYRPGVQHTV